jgi:hypothetical protein
MKNLRFSNRSVHEVGMRGPKVTCELIDRGPPNDRPRWHVEDGVLGPQLVDRGTPAFVIAFAENLLEIAIK